MAHTFDSDVYCDDCWIDGHGMIHLMIGLTKDGWGPAEGTPDFDHWGCWCCDPKCDKWHGTWNARSLLEYGLPPDF